MVNIKLNFLVLRAVKQREELDLLAQLENEAPPFLGRMKSGAGRVATEKAVGQLFLANRTGSFSSAFVG